MSRNLWKWLSRMDKTFLQVILIMHFSIDEYDEILEGKIKVPPYGLQGSDFCHPDKEYALARNKYSKKL